MKVGFVVQRYGANINDATERLCRMSAERMTRHWQVEVLTTCARDSQSWENAYPEGLSLINGVRIRRFPVDFPRVRDLFDRTSRAVFSSRNAPGLEEKWMREHGPTSSALIEHLTDFNDQYSAFIFFGYRCGTTFYGIQEVGHKSLLVPMAHDEPPFYLNLFKTVFSKPRGLLYLSSDEQHLVNAQYEQLPPGEVAGVEGCPAPRDLDLIEQKYLSWIDRVLGFSEAYSER